MKTPTLAVTLLLLVSLGTAHAGLVLSPESVFSNSFGEISSSLNDGNLIDQSSLSAGFVSGSTDFAAYLAGDPTHFLAGTSGRWLSPGSPTLPGSLVFDLGASQNVEQVVVWQAGVSSLQIEGISLATSQDPSGGFAEVGDFNVQRSDDSLQPAQVFDLTDSIARYVRLTINTSGGSAASSFGFGEIAFDVSAIPEPSAALFGSLLTVVLVAKRRRQRLSM